MATANDLEAIVTQLELDSERMHIVVNGDAQTTAFAEDGSPLPSIRKTLVDNLQFKTPPIAWAAGTLVRVYNQLYVYDSKWWYSPVATNSNVVTMGVSPVNDPNWKLFPNVGTDSGVYAPINSPLFTGNPQGPTPSSGDDSSSLATTQFIQDIASELRQEIAESTGGAGTFTAITVTGNSSLTTVSVSGAITAPNSDATLHRIVLNGADAELTFANAGTAPVVGAPLTSVKPYSITTYDLVSTKVETGNITAKDIVAEHLHLTGNGADPAGTQQLIVDGNTTLNNLNVTGTVTGISVSVDGQAINPSSVTAPTGTFDNLTVNNTLDVGGTTNLVDLNVTGTVTGISANVNGIPITPSSVTTGSVGVTGDVNINGATNVADLNITGTVTGLVIPPPSVDGILISPSGVDIDSVFIAKEQVLDDDDVTVLEPAVLQALIPMDTTGIANVGDISTSSITATTGSVDNLTSNHIRMVAGVSNANGATTISNLYSIQNITLTGNAQFSAPTPLPPYGENYILYLIQDATGGRVATFGAEFVPLNDAVINTAPNSITMVQVIYRGAGTLYDLVVTPRP